MPLLIALAGPSRSGKGTSASVIRGICEARGLTFAERQLSGPGKQYVADAFRPGITEEEAISWFEEMKTISAQQGRPAEVRIGWPSWDDGPLGMEEPDPVPLQQYLQRMLQGARDRWGTDFWTDKILPEVWQPGDIPTWEHAFPAYPDIEDSAPADICVVSDLRQVSEATRVKTIKGTVVECYRPKTEDAYATGRDHITEQRLPRALVDHTLLNDGAIEAFVERTTAYFEAFLPKETP